MASRGKKFKVRRNLKARKSGRDRKRLTDRDGSTPSKAVFFGDDPKTETRA